uniref:Secreted protein n=1 Tax=Steinernema glaseri TaxID=37863 RepID=A0A1I7ZK70_9BILA
MHLDVRSSACFSAFLGTFWAANADANLNYKAEFPRWHYPPPIGIRHVALEHDVYNSGDIPRVPFVVSSYPRMAEEHALNTTQHKHTNIVVKE